MTSQRRVVVTVAASVSLQAITQQLLQHKKLKAEVGLVSLPGHKKLRLHLRQMVAAFRSSVAVMPPPPPRHPPRTLPLSGSSVSFL
jgi:hypothetical protein